MDSHIAFRWVVALRAEAEVLLSQYEMKSVDLDGVFQIFRNASGIHWLIISGPGRINIAAATIYLHQNSEAPPWAAWINLGIAGSGKGNLGDLYLIDKITEKATDAKGYPCPIVSKSIPRAALITLDKPSVNYKEDVLFDMEGSSFFEIASRLSCQQLIFLLKIVSDGPNNDINTINRETIVKLITSNFLKINGILDLINPLMKIEFDRLKIPDIYLFLTKKWHFTKYQRSQLKNLVLRWKAVHPRANLPQGLKSCQSAESVLRALSNEISDYCLDCTEK